MKAVKAIENIPLIEKLNHKITFNYGRREHKLVLARDVVFHDRHGCG